MGRRCHIPARGEKGGRRSFVWCSGCQTGWIAQRGGRTRARCFGCVGTGEREGSTTPKAIIDDLPLFAATPTQTAPVASEPNELEQMLNEILPDELTPREALQKLYELKEALK